MPPSVLPFADADGSSQLTTFRGGDNNLVESAEYVSFPFEVNALPNVPLVLPYPAVPSARCRDNIATRQS